MSGKINCVVVKDLSRFARNYSDAGSLIDNFVRAIVPPSLSHYIYIIPLPGRDNKDASASGHFVSK